MTCAWGLFYCAAPKLPLEHFALEIAALWRAKLTHTYFVARICTQILARQLTHFICNLLQIILLSNWLRQKAVFYSSHVPYEYLSFVKRHVPCPWRRIIYSGNPLEQTPLCNGLSALRKIRAMLPRPRRNPLSFLWSLHKVDRVGVMPARCKMFCP